MAGPAVSHNHTDFDLACSPLLDGIDYPEKCGACGANTTDPVQGVLVAEALCHFNLLVRHLKESLGECQRTFDFNELLSCIWCPEAHTASYNKCIALRRKAEHDKVKR